VTLSQNNYRIQFYLLPKMVLTIKMEMCGVVV